MDLWTRIQVPHSSHTSHPSGKYIFQLLFFSMWGPAFCALHIFVQKHVVQYSLLLFVEPLGFNMYHPKPRRGGAYFHTHSVKAFIDFQQCSCMYIRCRLFTAGLNYTITSYRQNYFKKTLYYWKYYICQFWTPGLGSVYFHSANLWNL